MVTLLSSLKGAMRHLLLQLDKKNPEVFQVQREPRIGRHAADVGRVMG